MPLKNNQKHFIAIGDRYGRVIIVREVAKKSTSRRVLCLCDCGQEKEINLTALVSGKAQSCGCIQRESRIKHGFSGSRLVSIHEGMTERCHNPKATAYARYGGAGILVCEEWRGSAGIKAFIAWSLSHGYAEDLEIDRKNNSLGYSPENCRWATELEQVLNRGCTVRISDGSTLYGYWKENNHAGLPYPLVARRVYYGWDLARAISAPARPRRRMKAMKAMAAMAIIFFCIGAFSQTMVPILTRSVDNQRSGWNSHETLLTQQSVSTKGVRLLTTIPVYGDRNGIEAASLIVPQIKTPRGVFDIMVLCSMANQCRGVDARTGAAIWDRTLGMPVDGAIPFNDKGSTIDSYQVNNHWGALPTGAVDPGDNRFYQVFWMSPDGTGRPQTARYYMAVLNVADGSQVVPPVMITGTSQGYDFNAQMRKARSSAVLLNQSGVRTVLECTGTILETSAGAAGFCFAFDTYTNKVTAMTALTAGEGAGFWQGGQGLSCDTTSTYCYGITGNGDFQPPSQWGESFIQLQYTAPTAANPNGGKITINKGYSPWTDFQRSGQAQVPTGKIAGQSMPSDALRPVGGSMGMSLKGAKLVAKMDAQGKPVTLVYPNMATGAWADEDWGSSGPACIFQIGYCVAAGKDGEAFVLPVPGFTATTSATVGTVANCRYAQPVWLTMSPGNIDPCPADPRTLNFFPNGDTAHLHMTPVQMYDPLLKSWTIFAWGENQQLHKWAISSTGKLSWVANGHEYASANVRDNPPAGMPGGFCVGSSNGGDPNSAILACSVPRGDANKRIVQGDLIIYDPIHLGADGYLKKLWSSADWGWNQTFNKFMPPMIDGGQIYWPNYSGGIVVLGLN